MMRRVHIDRLELDLRGVSPATADRAARLLGPALAKALERRGAAPRGTGASHVDAGRIEAGANIEPPALARQMAGHIARGIRG
jgi:hypothetical protein